MVAENGKNKAEALASVAKGNETVEWACSMPQLMQVSSPGLLESVSFAADGRATATGRPCPPPTPPHPPHP